MCYHLSRSLLLGPLPGRVLTAPINETKWVFYQVGEAYRALVEFVASSWELYKAELESVTFPVFVHCYLTLVEAGYGEQVIH